MIELWVKPSALRKGHDPDHPKLEDIRGTDELARLADRVVLETAHAAWVMKDRDNENIGPSRPLRHSPEWPQRYRRIVYYFYVGLGLETWALEPEIDVRDRDIFRAMEKSLFRCRPEENKG